jgi:hypothetical protein
MVTEQVAGVPKRVLGRKILSLQVQGDQIMNAIDFLFRGL